MAKNSKQTSAKATTAASKVLRDGRTGKNSKTAAGSALSQTPSKITPSDQRDPCFPCLIRRNAGADQRAFVFRLALLPQA